MEATAIKEINESIIIRDGYKLLPCAAIYGANSSGKSNFLNAIGKFREMIIESTKLNSSDKLDITPFLLNPETQKEPSFFEIELLIDTNMYRYGFIADNEKVTEEWLYTTSKGKKKEKCFFVRTTEGIGVTDAFNEGKGLEEKTRDNALFLSVVDSFNGTIAKKIIRQITLIAPISGINHERWKNVTYELCNRNKDIQQKTKEILQSLQPGFKDFEIPEDKELARKLKAYTLHNLYDNKGNVTGVTKFNMQEHESSGTNKIFDLIVVIICTLKYGYLTVIDELDSKLHPIITRKIIDMFNDPEENTGGGQLIFATHDTNLLNINTLRRDQIWFAEKDKTEATDLYSLVEFKEPDGTKVRNDRSLEKDYINGRYGAIPYIKG